MHEIRVTLPPSSVPVAVRLANGAGIRDVTACDVFVYGPATKQIQLSVETSTPEARAFTDALTSAPELANVRYTLTSREIRAIVSDIPPGPLTRPMREPLVDVIQDFWQLSHVTWSYLARALAGAVLLADGIIANNAIAIVVSALFLPFLAQVIAAGMGIWNKDIALAWHGMKAVLTSILLAFAGGIAVALVEGGPIQFTGFRGPAASFAISAVIGITAGLSASDDTGRRYLIGVAAAVQLAVFPVWLGAAVITGLPDGSVLIQHLLSFAINLVTICGAAVMTYALGMGVSAHRAV